MILLISCNTTIEPYPVYPLGMAIIADALQRKGYEVMQRDILVSEDWQEEIGALLEQHAFEAIGLSIRNVDDVNYCKGEVYFEHYRQIVQFVKQHSGSPVIMGGSGYSIFPKEMLEFSGADYGIVGEGEAVFIDLIQAIGNGDPPAERILQGESYIEPKRLIPSSRDADLADYYLQNGGMLNVQSKRGCPHRCVYCSYPVLEGVRYRFRDPKDVVDEIERLKSDYHADYLSFTDSVFNDARGNYLSIAEELVRRGNRTPWMAFFRPDDFTTDQVELLKRSGLHAVEWGTDASTDITLQGLQKGFTWQQVQRSNRLFVEAGIQNAHFVIFAGPDETMETVEQGIENVNALEHCVVFASIGLRVFPDTPIWKNLVETGVIDEDTNLLEPYWFFSPDVDREKLHQRLLEAFEGRRDRIYPDGQQLEMIRAFHAMGYRGPLWNMILSQKRTRRRK